MSFHRISKILSCCCPRLLVAALPVFSTPQSFAFDEFELDAPFALEEEIPVVLTASRLKQPRAEVPASVTVISADQIQAWGVRTIPELMRFVPGMFVGHGDDENNASVIYHASNPNIMRRLQVLIDGRSVYRAAIASVVWDDMPVALEDIDRIEVTRGPNAASYGANSYLGVINIVTKHPTDTLGTRIRYRNGNQGYDDSFVSYSGEKNDTSYRITAQINADDGYDGRNVKNKDEYRDSRRHGFVTAYTSTLLAGGDQLDMQFSYKKGHTDIRKDEAYDTTYPDQETEQGVIWSRLRKEFSTDHHAHLQAYWQMDHREQKSTACVPAAALDPDLFRLYQLNQDLAWGVFTGAVQPADLMTMPLSADEIGLLSGVFGRASAAATDIVCGETNRSSDEQRIDIEWQDTVQWSDSFRTVSGLSYRRDQVNSKTLFNGKVNNDTYRLFANAEWHALDWLVLNAGGMYEIEDQNDNAFSPRLAANFLLAPQQSIRLVYSTAVRSPDLLEQSPQYAIRIDDLEDNYLGLSSGKLFVNQDLQRNLDHEEITSIELGYYGKVTAVEWDLKFYRDKLKQLISNPIALNTTIVTSDSEMEIDGVDLQLQWQATERDWLRVAAAYVNPVYKTGDTTDLTDKQIRSLERIELRASARDSVVASWHHAGDDWSVTASHFWYDAYLDDPDRRYRRYEINARKQWNIKKYSPWIGVFWHHIVDDNPLVYPDQYYATTDLYFVQAGVNF